MEKVIYTKDDNKKEEDDQRVCPFFLRRDNHNICDAGMIPYVPSFFKVENFCKTLNHKNCVIYGIEAE